MEAPPDDPLHSFHAALRNLERLEQEDFREIIKNQIRPTLRERYVTENYGRAALNVEMMVKIKETKQFQTLSLLARTIFELAVEVKLIVTEADAAKKIELFSKVERLKSARKIVDFHGGRPDAPPLYQQQLDFVNKFGTQIDIDSAAMWPSNPATGKKPSVKHWTLKDLRQRAKVLGEPFERLYETYYTPLSWMTHTGVVSPLNMTAESFSSFVSTVYSIAIDSYVAILETLVVEFNLSVVNEHIMRKIVCNRDLGFTRTPEEGEAVMKKHGLRGYFKPPRLWTDLPPVPSS